VIITSSHQFANGAARAIEEITEGTDRLIKLGSVGAPDGWKDLFEQKLLHGVFSWDNYEVLQEAAVAVKSAIRDDAAPQDYFPDTLFYRSANTFIHLSHPYSEDAPNRIFYFWR